MTPSRKTTDDLLQERKRKAEKLKVQIAALEARKRTEERRQSARRRFVVGTAALAHAETDPAFRAALRAALRAAVTRDGDKAVVEDLING